jgi:hypothetical protein
MGVACSWHVFSGVCVHIRFLVPQNLNKIRKSLFSSHYVVHLVSLTYVQNIVPIFMWRLFESIWGVFWWG